MSAITHTEGPWTYRCDGEANRYAIMGPDGDWLLTIQHNGRPLTAKQEANFRAICAVPEMLAALKEAASWIRAELNGRLPVEALANVEAAIAKAEPTS